MICSSCEKQIPEPSATEDYEGYMCHHCTVVQPRFRSSLEWIQALETRTSEMEDVLFTVNRKLDELETKIEELKCGDEEWLT